jgi:hypothetical protein
MQQEPDDPTPAYIHLRGTLGSQMFQIAAGYAFAKRHERRLALPGVSEGQRPLQYYDSYFHQLANKISPRVTGNRYMEPAYSYREIPSNMHDIYGYFQSSKYFADVSGEIRARFDPPPEFKEAVAAKWSSVLAAKDIGIVLDLRVSAHGFLTEEYYRRALASLRDRVGDADAPVFVFSEDVKWIQALPWLKEIGATPVTESDEAAAMYLMSQFRRFVVSNTAYSWWAAWLSGTDSTVAVPEPWNRPKDPQDTQDVYEPAWIRVPVEAT